MEYGRRNKWSVVDEGKPTGLKYLLLLLTSVVVFIDAGAQNGLTLEAENGSISGAVIDSVVSGYSGEGYVANLDSIGDYVEVDFTISEMGLYKLEIGYFSPSSNDSRSILWLDGMPIFEIRTGRTDVFLKSNAGTIMLSAEDHTLRLQFQDAILSVDNFTLTPVDDIAPIPLTAEVTRVEAEAGILVGTRVEFGNSGYSGQGYVSNFDMPDDDKVRITVDAPEAKAYDLTIGYAVPFGYKENYLRINGGPLQAIAFEEVIGFSEVTVGKINLDAGINILEISHFWGFFDLDYFEFNRVIGLPPVSVTQGNILRDDSNSDAFELVRLDGSHSQDPDGEIEGFSWIIDDTIIGLGPSLDFAFPIGTHSVALDVRDNDGNSDRSTFTVIIAELDGHLNNRLSIQDSTTHLFMSGINIAWSTNSNYAKDLLNYDESRWVKILDGVQAAGGNAIRWWLHTNGVQTPQFGSDGLVKGIQPEALSTMQSVLDLAQERGILVSMCLWSFDMLQDQGQNLQYTRALLEDTLAMEAYINEALVPIIEAVGDHPAVMTWEIFNEAEGMTWEFGWSHERTTMQSVQRFVNQCAGAIHRTQPEAVVSNGIWSMLTGSDSSGFYNYFRDDRLIAAGDDSLGTLDLVQVHYYGNLGTTTSPFHYLASSWGIDKPIIIGEFPADGISGYSIQECYDYAYRLGYAGALSWSYTDRQFGGLPASVPGIVNLFNSYPEDILVPDTGAVVHTYEPEGSLAVRLYPNPVQMELEVEFDTDEQRIQSYSIIDLRGTTVMQGRRERGMQSTIRVGHLTEGLYFLRLKGPNLAVVRSFIKNH